MVPASLIGNWKSEIERFAPSLKFWIAHPSESKGGNLAENPPPETLAQTDVVITTYGFLGRLPWLIERPWNLIVIDEAQAIKNPGS